MCLNLLKFTPSKQLSVSDIQEAAKKVSVLLVLIFYQRMESSFLEQIMNVGRVLLWEDTQDQCILCLNNDTFLLSSWVTLSVRIYKLLLCFLKGSPGLFNTYDTWAVVEENDNSERKSKSLPHALRHTSKIYKRRANCLHVCKVISITGNQSRDV